MAAAAGRALGPGSARRTWSACRRRRLRSPYYGLLARLRGFDPGEVGRMLEAREAVRMTLMRGTVHLALPADAAWPRPLVQVVIERGHNGAFGRRMGGADTAELSRVAAALLDEEPLGAPASCGSAAGRARDRRRRSGDRQRGPRLHRPGAGAAARHLGQGRPGAVHAVRAVDRRRARFPPPRSTS